MLTRFCWLTSSCLPPLATILSLYQGKKQLETECSRLQAELERVQNKLDVSKEKHLESQVKVNELTEKLTRAEQGSQLSVQQLAEQAGNLHAYTRSQVRGRGQDLGYSRTFSSAWGLCVVAVLGWNAQRLLDSFMLHSVKHTDWEKRKSHPM